MPSFVFKQILLFSCFACIATPVVGAKLRFAGVLGNSGDSAATLVTFSQKPACGFGPVLDGENAIWERAGSTRLNRYALDGRLLASFPLPDSNNKLRDQMTLAGKFLVFHFGRGLYRLPIEAASGSELERLDGNAELMSPSAWRGKVAILTDGQLFWLNPATGKQSSIVRTDRSLRQLFVDREDGTVYGFGNGEVLAWKDGEPVDGFPRPFNASRTQKIGRYWYSHGHHGTIHRFSERFEPDPGVVLGGASGSFIGYLPRSVDITHGTGLVHIRDDLFAVSGLGGVVQILRWDEATSKFEVVRRIGALYGLTALALDTGGNIWTPRGSLRWNDSSATPFTPGDVEPYHTTQPVLVDGKTVCFLKNHYNYIQKAHGPVIDASGWAHLETRNIKGVTLDESVRGSCAFTNSRGQLRLLVTSRDGRAMEFSLSQSGQIGDNPTQATLPGLTNCTSLAWFENHLLAGDDGMVVAFEQREDGWQKVAVPRIDEILSQTSEGVTEAGSSIHEFYVHSDGKRLVVTDAVAGQLSLFDSLKGAKPVVYSGLNRPTHVAVSGDRLIVYESGRQRLVKLELDAESPKPGKTFNRRKDARGTLIWNFADTDYYSLGRPGGLPLDVAMRERDGGTDLSFRIPDGTLEFKVGIANATDSFIVTSPNARIPTDNWSELRLAVFARRADQQERFGFQDNQPIHANFSDAPLDWAPFDLENYREVVAERRQQIRVDFEQPVDGKASLVIENEMGVRVRNLVSGRTFQTGTQTVVWDGLDDNGKLVAPGSFRWRGVTHPGVRPEFRMTFAGGGEKVDSRPWGPNHGLLHHAVANDKHIFFAAPVTEGGWALLALDANGNFVQGYEHQQGFGIGHNAIAVDDKYLYCAQDGFGWGGANRVNWSSDDWTATWTLTVARYDLQSGKAVEFPGKQRAFTADTMQVGPGSSHPDLKQYNLGGLTVLNGRVYVGSRDKNAVLVFDAESGKRIDSIPLAGVRHLTADAHDVFAATDNGISRLGDAKQIIDAGKMNISGLTVATNGDIWLCDRASHLAHRFTSDGKHVESLGKPGGPYKGAYDPDRMVNPTGLAFGPNGKLWVTEHRWNPKRVMAWDLEKKTIVYEKFGIPHYGGDGSGFDPENARRWIGLGCFWDVDIDAGTARPTHVMALDEGHFQHYHPHGYSFFREAGRTFLCTRGKIALLCEVLKDGTIRELAACCGTHHFAYGCRWKPPQAYIDAFYAKWPSKRKDEKTGRGATGKPWAGRVAGVLWVDRNGDGETQQDEFDFTDEGVKFADGAWGHRQDSLTFRFPAAVGKKVKVVEIKRDGFLPNGIPNYPSLNQALENDSTDVSLTPGHNRQGVSTARDRFGRFVFNSDPELNAFSSDGKHLWSFPNRWSNVHGSHKAPLPETGVMQGTMAILGMAPFDDNADVFFLNGNHGRCFLLTSDGLYLDEAFTDVRVSYLKNEYRLGGEIFGGMFDRSVATGDYYVQIGHGPYRIYQLHGIDQATRIAGTIDVTPQQIAAAERRKLRKLSQQQSEKTLQLPGTITWDQNGKFKVALQASVSDEHLHLTWQVQDPSPWINNGRDWTTLFATGDTVDLQLGANPNADPSRRKPVAGDKRLLIAPRADKQPIAVLYEHVKPGGTNPIEFTSPWRGARVDNVTELKSVDIKVKTSSSSYLVEASIPLQTLGLTPARHSLRADFGVTFGDADGTETQLRSYWANPATMLVDDIPGEVMLHPNLWGTVTLGR